MSHYRLWKDLDEPEKVAIEDKLKCKTFWTSPAGGTVVNKKEQVVLLKRWSGSYEETQVSSSTISDRAQPPASSILSLILFLVVDFSKRSRHSACSFLICL